MSRPDYATKPRIGYAPSRDLIRVTIPDSLRFPHQSAWVWFHSPRVLHIDPNPPERRLGAVLKEFRINKSTPGCRQIELIEVRKIGPHFSITPVAWERDGNRLTLHLPLDHERRAPIPKVRAHMKKKEAEPTPPPAAPEEPALQPEDEHETVRLLGFGSEWSFKLTPEELLELTAIASRMSHDE